MVGVGKELHRPSVVDEKGAVGLDDASGGVPVVIPKPRAYAAARIFNGRPVLQLHGSLVLCKLPFGAVAHHLNALPQLAGAGGSEGAAVHHELAAGTDDEAGILCNMHRLICPSYCCTCPYIYSSSNSKCGRKR